MAWFDKEADLLLDAEWDKKQGVQVNYGGMHGDLQLPEGYLDKTGIHNSGFCSLGVTRTSASLNKFIKNLCQK